MNLDKSALQSRVNHIAAALGTFSLGEMLAGGVISDVYAATLTHTGKNSTVVLKYTREDIDLKNIFSRKDKQDNFHLAQVEHNLDVQLQSRTHVATPKIIQHYPDDNITIMHDFRLEGFELLQKRLLEKTIPLSLAAEFGAKLADVRFDIAQAGATLKPYELSDLQFDERFLELRVLLYNSRMDIFNNIEHDFLHPDQPALTWTDGDQKNIATDAQGKMMVFDLGRAIVCDADFTLPNFLGHVGLFALAGYFDHFTEFAQECIKSFHTQFSQHQHGYTLDEQKFVNYFTAALLHRGMAMRWIDPRIAGIIGEDSLKNASMHFGDEIFDTKNRVTHITPLLHTLTEVQHIAQNGGYRRKLLRAR